MDYFLFSIIPSAPSKYMYVYIGIKYCIPYCILNKNQCTLYSKYCYYQFPIFIKL